MIAEEFGVRGMGKEKAFWCNKFFFAAPNIRRVSIRSRVENIVKYTQGDMVVPAIVSELFDILIFTYKD